MTPFNVPSVGKAGDDGPLIASRQDFSGGVNTRLHASQIADNQADALTNVDIGIPGKSVKRPGSYLIGNDVGNNTVLGLHNFEIQGATDQLLMYEGTSLYKWEGTGNWTVLKSDFSAATEAGIISAKESGLSPDDVAIIQNGVDHAFRLDANGNFQDLGATAGTGSDSPPISTVMAWYNNMIWVLKNDLLYFSLAYQADYSNTFDTVAAAFRVPVGTERGLIPTRDTGIIVMGESQIWGLAPSVTPDPTTDQPQPLITEHGVVSKKGWVNAGDDIYYFAKDGFRALRRTVQDKLQSGQSFPLSYIMKDEYERISWANIDKLCMVYFDNKIFISVPTSSTLFDTWIYYPALQAFAFIKGETVDSTTYGWTPTAWAKYKVSGEEFLYYGTRANGKVFRAWVGYTDEGTTTTDGTAVRMDFQGKEEDMGQPLITKAGGELEVVAETAGSGYTFNVLAAIDGASFSSLGYVLLDQETAPTLPVDLPFFLADSYKVRTKFHLESLGPWKTIQVQIKNSDANIDDIILYGYNIVTNPEEYQGE